MGQTDRSRARGGEWPTGRGERPIGTAGFRQHQTAIQARAPPPPFGSRAHSLSHVPYPRACPEVESGAPFPSHRHLHGNGAQGWRPTVILGGGLP